MAITLEQLSALRDKPVIDSDGEKIGDMSEVYYDEDTSEPRWVEVKRGFLSTGTVLVPVMEHRSATWSYTCHTRRAASNGRRNRRS